MNRVEGSKKLSGNKIFRNCICIFLCFLSLFPFYLLFINSTLKSSDIQGTIRIIPGLNFFKNLKGLLEGEAKTSNVNVLQAMRNSLIVTVPATFLQVYFAALTAYGVHTYNFKLKKAAWAFIYAIMMVPTQISIVGFIKVAKLTHTYRTYIPLIIPAMAAPTTVYFMKQYMEASLSYEIIEAARIDGTTEFGTFNRIVIPLIKPAMATQAIFAFVGSWNNLFTPTMIIGNERKKMTMPMYVEALKANDKTQDMGQIYCGLFVTVLPILVMYALLSRYIVAGVALGGVKE